MKEVYIVWDCLIDCSLNIEVKYPVIYLARLLISNLREKVLLSNIYSP